MKRDAADLHPAHEHAGRREVEAKRQERPSPILSSILPSAPLLSSPLLSSPPLPSPWSRTCPPPSSSPTRSRHTACCPPPCCRCSRQGTAPESTRQRDMSATSVRIGSQWLVNCGATNAVQETHSTAGVELPQQMKSATRTALTRREASKTEPMASRITEIPSTSFVNYMPEVHNVHTCSATSRCSMR